MNTSSQSEHEFRGRLADQDNRRSSRWIWILFSLFAVAAIGLFLIPAFIIRPFRYQAPRALFVAMALRQRAPLGTLSAGIASFVLALVLWRTASHWRRALIVLTLVLVTFSTVMSRENYFEWMFHPIAGPQFLAQSESKLDPKEMIMAVRFVSDARAYP
ncbi:MAG: hypothetical protein WAL96_11425, partial [Candidatus Sulfotelmatobacter sp.]